MGMLYGIFYFLICCRLLLLCCLLHVHLIALLTGNGKSNNQRNKLLKIHLAITVCVQVLHDLVDSSRVLLRLVWGGHREENFSYTALCDKIYFPSILYIIKCTDLLLLSHLKKVRQFVLHQLPELSSVECAALAILRGVTVEHLDEGLHGCLQFWRHLCWSVFRLKKRNVEIEKKLMNLN